MSELNPENDHRASMAYRALEVHDAASENEAEPLDTRISDLMSNLLHLTANQGLDVDELVARAVEHYQTEAKP